MRIYAYIIIYDMYDAWKAHIKMHTIKFRLRIAKAFRRRSFILLLYFPHIRFQVIRFFGHAWSCLFGCILKSRDRSCRSRYGDRDRRGS